jgi:hypothetical protein
VGFCELRHLLAYFQTGVDARIADSVEFFDVALEILVFEHKKSGILYSSEIHAYIKCVLCDSAYFLGRDEISCWRYEYITN